MHSYSTHSQTSQKRGTKRTIGQTFISSSSENEPMQSYKWTCKCKGKNWSPDIPNRSWGCDDPICNHAESEICLLESVLLKNTLMILLLVIKIFFVKNAH
eukprot:281280_1